MRKQEDFHCHCGINNFNALFKKKKIFFVLNKRSCSFFVLSLFVLNETVSLGEGVHSAIKNLYEKLRKVFEQNRCNRHHCDNLLSEGSNFLVFSKQ